MGLYTLDYLSILITCGWLFVFTLLAVRSIRWGLYLLAAMLPLYLIRFDIAGVPTTALELSILILFFLWLIKENRWRRIHIGRTDTHGVENLIPRHYRLPLTLLFLSALIGAFASQNTLSAFGILKAYFIEPGMVLLIATYELTEHKHIRLLIYALGIPTILIGATALYQYVTGFGIPNPMWANAATRRATSLFGYPNAGSLFVAPIIALYIGYMSAKRTVQEYIYPVVVVSAGLTMILTAKTMGALVGLGAAVWCAGVYSKKSRLPVLLCTVLLAAGIFFMTPIPQRTVQLFNRISSNHLNLSSSSFEIRVNQWRETTNLLFDHPLVGAGLAGYQQALVPYHRYSFLEIYLYPHNIFLNVWVELGLLGIIAFVLLFWRIKSTVYDALKAGYRTPEGSALTYGLFLAWITLFVHGLVDVPYFKNDLSVEFMLLVALTMFLDRTVSHLNRKELLRT